MQEHLWGIVLAGGEGRRLQPFIRACFGCDRPKQFCAFLGGRSMLRHTLLRAERMIPPEHLLIILTQPHLSYAQLELYDRPPATVIVQPCNRETGPGVLLPLLHIAQRDPEALVVLLPCDHFIRGEDRFMAAIGQAAAFVSEHPEYPVLLGVEPTGPEIEYGWIEPGEVLGDMPGAAISQIRRFWEKPPLPKAQRLYQQGALWNTMVLVVRAAVLLALFEAHTPALTCAFDPVRQALGSPSEADVVQQAYATLASVNFSEAILSPTCHRLGVIRVSGIYWSDWGDAARIQQDRARFGLQAPESHCY
jgi:mannose-1-phosphate guanylyltransferase